MENKMRKFRFNIVDVVVIVVILAVVAFFAIKFISFEETQPNAGAQRIRYTVRVDAMSREMYEEIAAKLPMQMLSNGNYIDGYVQSAEAVPCEVSEIEVRDGQNQTSVYHISPDGEYVTVDFYCEGTIEDGKLLNTVGTQEVRIGRTHYVKSNDVEVVGTVTSVERSAE